MTAVRDFFVAMALLAGSPALSDAGDWIFDSGPYTRSATTGKRVAQYQPLPKVDLPRFDVTKCATRLTIVGTRIPNTMRTTNHGYGDLRRGGRKSMPHVGSRTYGALPA